MVLAGLYSLAGCDKKGPNTSTQPDLDAPSYAELATMHNTRVAQLRSLYGIGVIEIRWTDDQGKRHFEQGDMELWMNLPRKTALRVEKLGEVLLWLGSNESHYWFFDRLGREKSLTVGSHDEAIVDQQGQALAVKPLALLDLMGLTELPVASNAATPITYDQVRDAWVIQVDGIGGRVRLFFGRQSLLPVRIESVSAGGQAWFSDLRRYESVRQQGMNPAAFPKMAQLIDIADMNPEARSNLGQVKIAINQYTDGDDQPFDRVFDLERLVKSFQPERVEGRMPE